MQRLGRLLTVFLALAFGFGTFSLAVSSFGPAHSTAMAADADAAMAKVDAGMSSCGRCSDEPYMTQDCWATCTSIPALAPQEAVRFSSPPASYEPAVEKLFSGAESRPDPYPPRPTILA